MQNKKNVEMLELPCGHQVRWYLSHKCLYMQRNEHRKQSVSVEVILQWIQIQGQIEIFL